MKNAKILLKVLLLTSAIVITGCSAPKKGGKNGYAGNIMGGNTYTELSECDFVDVTENNLSNISLSVNTASYTDVRNQIFRGNKVSKDAVKIEEIVNYFHYNYSLPQDSKPLSMNSIVIDTPWNDETKLLLVGMQAEEIERSNQENNIVFLIDVSGSMYGEDRLDLVKSGFNMMVDQLNENDKVSIVTYASSQRVILDGVSGAEKLMIKNAISDLQAGGSTSGGSAIQKAYDVAFKHKTDTNNSTIIIATDGDFNVGVSNPTALKALISEKSRQGVHLSAIGVGFGNMRSDMLETIASAGDGRHGYITDMTEAKKFLVEEIGAIFNIVAKDAKAQIEFNADTISQFRLIGYENRQLTLDEFEDEETQAGAIGSQTQVTAMYEIKLKEVKGDLAKVTLKYKMPSTNESKQDEFIITENHLNPSSFTNPTIINYDDAMFIASVIEFGLLLRESSFKGSASYENIYLRLMLIENLEQDIYKNDYLSLIEILKNKYK